MKKILFFIVSLCVCITFLNPVSSVYASTLMQYGTDYTVTYDSSVYTSDSNMYSNRSFSDANWFELFIGRNLGDVLVLPHSNNIQFKYAVGSTFTYSQTISLNEYFSVRALAEVNDTIQYTVAQNPFIRIDSTYTVTSSQANGKRLTLTKYNFGIYHTPTIGGGAVNITTNHLLKVKPITVHQRYECSYLNLHLFPTDLFPTYQPVDYFYIMQPYFCVIDYNFPDNNLYYVRSTSNLLMVYSPFWYNPNYVSGGYYRYHVNMVQNYRTSSSISKKEIAVFDGYEGVRDITSDQLVYSFIFNNNATYNNYYSYGFQYWLHSNHINDTSSNTTAISDMNYFIYYFPLNGLYGGYSSDNHNSGLISFDSNKYYQTPSSDWDILTKLYNFFIYFIFDMPLVSDIIKFFITIVDLVLSIFTFFTSFAFENPIILSIIGLFFLIFLLRFLL